MNCLSLIESKRAGKSLGTRELRELVSGVVAGTIPDYQLAALLMAVLFRGLTPKETATLTLAMRDSGDVLKFPKDRRPVVDKHSTGGVGDKVSLPLAPLLACLGFRVPMISGRGLGITGGTLDKLDSIPGYQTLLTAERIQQIVAEVGCVICGQTERMVPADRKLYALRDVTGTVPSIPLITASILSKKLAEGLDALVLDVKFGCAAFMQTPAEARTLARAMVKLGKQCGVNTRAILTDMNTPLGRAAGNWLEVKESVQCLEPRTRNGPATIRDNPGSSAAAGGPDLADLRELVITCAAHLLVQTRRSRTLAQAKRTAEACLDSGAPLTKWHQMLAAQGADLAAYRGKLARDGTAPVMLPVPALRSGYVAGCDARVLGEVIRDLGGGRQTKDSPINYDVGIDAILKPGEAIRRGGPLARIHAATSASARSAAERLRVAFKIVGRQPKALPLVLGTIAARH